MWYSRTQYVNHSVFHFSFLLVHSHSHSHSQSRQKNVYQNDPRNWSIWSIKRNARQLQKKNKILSPQKCDEFTFLAHTVCRYDLLHMLRICIILMKYWIPFDGIEFHLHCCYCCCSRCCCCCWCWPNWFFLWQLKIHHDYWWKWRRPRFTQYHWTLCNQSKNGILLWLVENFKRFSYKELPHNLI